jgi:hypothetical protein
LGGARLLTSTTSREDDTLTGLDERVTETLNLFARWGHAVPTERLAALLLGGAEEPAAVQACLDGLEGAVVHRGIVTLRGCEDLLAKTRRRLRAHDAAASVYLQVARAYAADLLRWCPFLQCIALSGSLATGGFEEGDDVDFDLFVRSGTKYTSYLLANLVGLPYAWRHRHRPVDALHRTPFLPKITCVNVVWPEDQTRPFLRQDVGLAFELMRCRPLYGADRFRTLLEDNPWLRRYFPQLYDPAWEDEVTAEANPVGRFLASLERWPSVLRIVEAASKGIAWILYRYVQWTRRRSPEAVARMAFLRRVKWPYEVFQD